MRILVIEDNPSHIQQAKSMLHGHEVTVCASYNDAADITADDLEFNPLFDVVLIGLDLPIFKKIKKSADIKYGVSIPFGVSFIKTSLYKGISVAIVSDVSNQSDPMNWVINYIKASVENTNYRFIYHGEKKWAKALQRLTE